MSLTTDLDAAGLVALERNHAGLLGLCLTLEEIADSIPFDVDSATCRAVTEALGPLLGEAHRLEEEILFPDFDKNAGSCFAAMMIERLKAEHRCDGLACEEMVRTLGALVEGRCALPPETVRYMLQGFLEGLRRHVSSERLMMETLLAAKAEGREVFA
ncbi:hemerythrin domain-containing protein [Rhizobium sp. S-51]|uniref:Hemerythrin domain-containing protein n=1 Tax=Rhizobium terricola TaxID=2728849 RepID=A0A7Y0FYF8_9HYPH|nr:hemerythrin domain-containing protein [Rhizobium terricola]NML76966.1 hemerythrin domain-containing protein [Rhizobium terricola]